MNYPSWFDYHPLKETLIKRYQRKATFIIRKDDPLVQPLFDQMDILSKPMAMAVALDRVQATIQCVFSDSDYQSVLHHALIMGRQWLNHDITMTQMRPVILHIHGLTKSSSDLIINRHLHAIGQALSTLHCQDHLKGWYLYSFAAWFYQDPNHFEPLKWIEQETNHLQPIIESITVSKSSL